MSIHNVYASFLLATAINLIVAIYFTMLPYPGKYRRSLFWMMFGILLFGDGLILYDNPVLIPALHNPLRDVICFYTALVGAVLAGGMIINLIFLFTKKGNE